MKHQNKLFAILAAALTLSALPLNASVSFSGVAATGIRDNSGVLIPVGSLVLMIADTGAAGFGSATDGSLVGGESLAENAFLVGDYIVQRNSSGNSFGVTQAPGTVTAENLTTSIPTGTVTPGTPFAVMWFTQAAATTTAILGENYGIVRDTGWLFPADGSAYTFTTSATPTSTQFRTVQNAGNAVNTIGPVPEPSRLILLGLGGMGLLLRRRRC
jgi:PEP-CTERM motif